MPNTSLYNGGAHGDGMRNSLGPHLPEYVYNGEVAISGISGRLPESANVAEFRDHLMNKEDMTTEDNRRWEVVKSFRCNPRYLGEQNFRRGWGGMAYNGSAHCHYYSGLYGLPPRSGKVKELRHFDAAFFGVHPKQADCMDPQLRMLLEVTYEAIIDAGQTLEGVRGSRTGVFVGLTTSESPEAWTLDPENVVGYTKLGCNRAMLANRVSYFFDFKGPSMATDTACASSLTCLDQALINFRMGIIDSAIVAGTSLCLKPYTALELKSLGMTSPTGYCKSFDASGINADACVKFIKTHSLDLYAYSA